jgi:hypothetical protein
LVGQYVILKHKRGLNYWQRGESSECATGACSTAYFGS